jgi:Leucine-rich repeat (LRR) protein
MHESLRFLDLSHNLINVFPSQLLMFPNLQSLILDHNRISTFAQILPPDRTLTQTSLRILSFHHNQVDSLPEKVLGLCCSVTELWMHNNMLVELSPSTSILTGLHTLTLSSNRLKQLPDVFDQLILKELWIQQNPLVHVPNSIWRRKIPIFLHNLSGTALG